MNHEDEVREMAYYHWLAAGSPIGDGVEFWLVAEKQYWEAWDRANYLTIYFKDLFDQVVDRSKILQQFIRSRYGRHRV